MVLDNHWQQSHNDWFELCKISSGIVTELNKILKSATKLWAEHAGLEHQASKKT
jgi:hypothetical protein